MPYAARLYIHNECALSKQRVAREFAQDKPLMYCNLSLVYCDLGERELAQERARAARR